ncbi:MAG: hypothetical protein SF029_25225 [bacterium]|nr:hypothetical protein [bacterium]
MDKPSTPIGVNMSLDEFKSLIRETVRKVLLELVGQDESSEPEFQAAIAERLRSYERNKPIRIPIDDAMKALELDTKDMIL